MGGMNERKRAEQRREGGKGGAGGGRVRDGEKEAMLSSARCLYHYAPGEGREEGRKGEHY